FSGRSLLQLLGWGLLGFRKHGRGLLMCSDVVINVENVGKCYQIYDQPRDRLKQFFLPRARRLIGLPAAQYYRDFWALKNISFQIN
ncbi:hypothetical protein ACOI9Y_31640, partial [Mesorhizobium japonicum]